MTAADPPAGAFDTEQARILLIEDNPDDMEYLYSILSREFSVTTAQSAPEALQLFEHFEYDVVLADNTLPGMQGEALLRECQQRRPVTTRILLSAVLDLEMVLHAVNDGHIFAALKKPVKPGPLLTTLHNAARSCRLVRERSLLISELANANALVYEEQQQLLSINDELRMLVTIATHDLREPLRSTRFFLDQCLNAMQDTGNEELLRHMERVKKAHLRMDQLLVGLREWLHLRTGTFELETLDIGIIVVEAIDNLSRLLVEREVDLHVPDKWPIVMGNAPLLRSVFENLISNAVRFSPEGPPHISLEWRNVGGFVRFSCSDKGIGIDPAYHHQVFGMFKRLESKRKFEGTGAGLAICQKIIERHGGQIGVESIRGEGATFWFTVPQYTESGENSLDTIAPNEEPEA